MGPDRMCPMLRLILRHVWGSAGGTTDWKEAKSQGERGLLKKQAVLKYPIQGAWSGSHTSCSQRRHIRSCAGHPDEMPGAMMLFPNPPGSWASKDFPTLGHAGSGVEPHQNNCISSPQLFECVVLGCSSIDNMVSSPSSRCRRAHAVVAEDLDAGFRLSSSIMSR